MQLILIAPICIVVKTSMMLCFALTACLALSGVQDAPVRTRVGVLSVKFWNFTVVLAGGGGYWEGQPR